MTEAKINTKIRIQKKIHFNFLQQVKDYITQSKCVIDLMC